jgi:peroxiredoxin
MRLIATLMLPLLLLTSHSILAQDGTEKEPKPEGEVGTGEAKPEGEDKPADGEAKEEAEPETAVVGKKAPGFTLKNAEGKEVKLSDYAGKIVVIEWINLDCPACKRHYAKDELVKQQQKVREDGGAWLLICSSGKGKQGTFDAETLKTRIKKVNLDASSYLLDEEGAVGKAYKAKTTPHTFVIDKQGVLRYQGALDNTPQQMRNKAEPVNYVAKALEAITADKEVAEKEVKPYG